MTKTEPEKALLICGAHISENLLHHKMSDVIRILEEKGFVPADKVLPPPKNDRRYRKPAGFQVENVRYYAMKDGSDDGKRTVVLLDDNDFVLQQDGVRFYTL